MKRQSPKMSYAITVLVGGSDAPPEAYPNVRLDDLMRFPDSMLARVADMRRKESGGKNLILELPHCDARLFAEVLKYVGDPPGYVLPERDADAIKEQLAYLGLTDLRTDTQVKTRRQMEAERDAQRASTLAALSGVVLHYILDMAVAEAIQSGLAPPNPDVDSNDPTAVESFRERVRTFGQQVQARIHAHLGTDESFAEYLSLLELESIREVEEGMPRHVIEIKFITQDPQMLRECRAALSKSHDAATRIIETIAHGWVGN